MIALGACCKGINFLRNNQLLDKGIMVNRKMLSKINFVHHSVFGSYVRFLMLSLNCELKTDKYGNITEYNGRTIEYTYDKITVYDCNRQIERVYTYDTDMLIEGNNKYTYHVGTNIGGVKYVREVDGLKIVTTDIDLHYLVYGEFVIGSSCSGFYTDEQGIIYSNDGTLNASLKIDDEGNTVITKNQYSRTYTKVFSAFNNSSSSEEYKYDVQERLLRVRHKSDIVLLDLSKLWG